MCVSENGDWTFEQSLCARLYSMKEKEKEHTPKQEKEKEKA